MVNTKKVFLGFILAVFVLVSATAVLATTAIDESTANITVSHGASGTGTFTLNNTHLTVNDSVTLTHTASSAGETVTFSPVSPVNVTNGTTTTVTYTVTVPAYTTPQNYTFTIDSDDANTPTANTDTLTVTLTVPTDNSYAFVETALSENVESSLTETFNFSVANSGNVPQTVSFNMSDLTLNWDDTTTLSASSITGASTIALNSTEAYSFTVPTVTATEFGEYTGTLTLTNTNGDLTLPVTLLVVDADYDAGLKMTHSKIEDLTENSNKIRPGDTINLKDVEVDNNLGRDIENVDVTVTVLFAEDGDDIFNYEHDSFDLDKRKKDDFDVEFQVPWDAEAGRYVVEYMVHADDAENATEYTNWAWYEFTVMRSSNHLAISEIALDAVEYCSGTTVTIPVSVSNIGTSNLDESDDIAVRLRASDLSYDKTMFWNDDLDESDTETLNFEVPIPSSLAAGDYVLSSNVKHKGDKNSADEGAEISETITISSCLPESTATASTTLFTGPSSETAAVGSAARYALTITNSGNEIADYNLVVSGISSWGTATVEPVGTISVPAGQVTTVYVYLTPSASATTSNSATVELQSNGTVVGTKQLTLNLAGAGVSTYSNAIVGQTFSELGADQQGTITLISMLVVAVTGFGAALTGVLRQNKNLRKRLTKRSKRRRR